MAATAHDRFELGTSLLPLSERGENQSRTRASTGMKSLVLEVAVGCEVVRIDARRVLAAVMHLNPPLERPVNVPVDLSVDEKMARRVRPSDRIALRVEASLPDPAARFERTRREEKRSTATAKILQNWDFGAFL